MSSSDTHVFVDNVQEYRYDQFSSDHEVIFIDHFLTMFFCTIYYKCKLSILGLYLQLKLFRKSRHVTQAVSYIIAALISCNFIIKNYVSRKITSYIFLLIFTKIIMTSCQTFYCTNEKGKCEKIFFCNKGNAKSGVSPRLKIRPCDLDL